MKYYISFTFLFISFAMTGQSRDIAKDTIIRTTHSIEIKGQNVPYEALAGMQPVWNKQGDITATMFFTYYRRTDVKDIATRPIIFSFNGGPGSASVWMHVAYTGPVVLNIDEEGYPIQPYGYKKNPNSILDVADIVYVDPVGTGYSIMLEDKDGKMPDREQFFGINADIKYLASWMNTFVTRHNRWLSPKYIIGESYGGIRVMGLSSELQNQQNMYLNGVIMVSPGDYKLLYTGNVLSSVIYIPYFTAVAWYHKMLSPELQSKDLLEILPEVEDFALYEVLPALSKGGFISDTEKQAVAEKIAYYSGLSKKAVLSENLDVSTSFFWKELLRDKNGMTIGRLDSRYLGIDKKLSGVSPDYNAEMKSWDHSFTPAINHYIKNVLKFETDIPYGTLNYVGDWDKRNDNVRESLRLAMAENPYLKVLIQSGYYDGATTYFQAKQTMWLVDPSGQLKDRFTFKGYKSGHMMYLRNEDLKNATNDLREFINNTYRPEKPAKY